MRELSVRLILGNCKEPMCEGAKGHACDHYVQRMVNGARITTFWPKDYGYDEVSRVINEIEGGRRHDTPPT
jgi:hypothetical protein